MATVIRFARHGSKKRPFYRIVVQDSRFKRDGRFIEKLGTFDPIKGLESLSIARPRLDYWLGTGAQLSTAVATKLKAADRGRFRKKSKVVAAPVVAAETAPAAVEAAPVAEQAPEEPAAVPAEDKPVAEAAPAAENAETPKAE